MHSALRFFAARDWPGAPRLLEELPDGAEALTYLPGRVPLRFPPDGWARSDAALVAVARLVRQFHDFTAGTDLADGAEVLCHADLAPNNTVYREESEGGLPYAFIDWDLAAPGRRVEDVAHVCWQWLGLGPDVADIGETARQVHLVVTAYGFDLRVSDVLNTVLWWQDRCARGIDAEAEEGHPAMRRLVDDGVPDAIRAARSWTAAHLGELADVCAR